MCLLRARQKEHGPRNNDKSPNSIVIVEGIISYWGKDREKFIMIQEHRPSWEMDWLRALSAHLGCSVGVQGRTGRAFGLS